ncbi:hypothetical protein AMTRI_Chr06g170110 [Amborella trichopoda]
MRHQQENLCEYRRTTHNVILIIRVMIHQPASPFYEAPAGEFILEAGDVYVQRTCDILWVVFEDIERDVFMSATEAQAHGIVDLIVVKKYTWDFLYPFRNIIRMPGIFNLITELPEGGGE